MSCTLRNPYQANTNYRQITASNAETGPGYEVRIFGGDAVISEHEFKADSLERSFTHTTRPRKPTRTRTTSATDSLKAGWVMY